MNFTVTILGSNSAIPTSIRNPSSQLINHRERYFLVDCAEGTQIQLRKFKIRFQKINHIFISHLHGDHYFGLVGLISTLHLLGRKKDLHIYAPSPLQEIINLQLASSKTELAYSVIYHSLNETNTETIYEDQKLTVKSIPLKHSIPTCGFIFQEKPLKRKIRKEFLKTTEIPVQHFQKIKNGEDFIDSKGEKFDNQQITFDPADPKSFAYISDTAYFEKIIPEIKNINLLYHEATFLNEMADVAKEKLHSTATEAAIIAKKANAGKLIIGHYSSRYDDPKVLEEEARTIFPETQIAMDGNVFTI